MVTAVTSSSFSVTYASGVVQSGISLTNGYLDIGITYTPSAGIKYVEIEAVGSGSSGGTTQYNGGDSVVGNFIAVAGGSNSKMSNVGDFISPGSTGFSWSSGTWGAITLGASSAFGTGGYGSGGQGNGTGTAMNSGSSGSYVRKTLTPPINTMQIFTGMGGNNNGIVIIKEYFY